MPLSTCARGGSRQWASRRGRGARRRQLSRRKARCAEPALGRAAATTRGKAAASRRRRRQGGLLRAAEAEAALAAARRDLVAESRALECSLSFIEERMADDVVEAATAAEASGAATNLADSRSEISEMSKSSEVSEIQLSYGQVYYPSVRRLLERPLVRGALNGTHARFLHLGSNIGTESFYVSLTLGPEQVRVEGYDLLCSLVRRAEALRERFAMMTPARVRFHCADALTTSWTSALCGSTARHGTSFMQAVSRNWRRARGCPCR